jgi:ornithine cyclodeaminase/alanine dehydrogenase-like protein (mu-crystallin family)
MKLLHDADVKARLNWADIIQALEAAFVKRAQEPAHFIQSERTVLSGAHGTYLIMPCADSTGYFGVKQVAVMPQNPLKQLPSVQAWYTLFNESGTPTLSCSATLLTKLRTAAVSAVAARYLVNQQARTLLVIGTGSLAPYMAQAHQQVRPYTRILIWGRNPDKAQQAALTVAEQLAKTHPQTQVAVAADLAAAASQADVITVATTARSPILKGTYLRPGQHIDLVGAFTPEMAEADAETVKQADVFVDDRESALVEAGDLLQAQAQGWSWELVEGDLSEVVTSKAGRANPNRMTLFKSVGLALEDLVVAKLLLE